MRPHNTRARAAFGMGAIGTAMATAAATAAAADAPAPTPAQPATFGAALAAPATKSDARLRIASKRLNVRAGRSAVVRGTLAPARAGRNVTLERRAGRGWRTIDKARTSRTGR